jgi:hypothetical protein
LEEVGRRLLIVVGSKAGDFKQDLVRNSNFTKGPKLIFFSGVEFFFPNMVFFSLRARLAPRISEIREIGYSNYNCDAWASNISRYCELARPLIQPQVTQRDHQARHSCSIFGGCTCACHQSATLSRPLPAKSLEAPRSKKHYSQLY